MAIGLVQSVRRTGSEAAARMLARRQHRLLERTLNRARSLDGYRAALGTIAGGYEAGFETVIRLAGVKPKYLASTATIQRADDQCRSLYGRDAFLFPPPAFMLTTHSSVGRTMRYPGGRLSA